jgi:shikimate kinase
MTDAPDCRVVLLGMMGSGKTTLGRRLAALTGWPYHDNDALVAEATGRTARELAADGVRSLREAEAAALRRALALPSPVIAGAAAGVVTDPELRDRLKRAGVVVWLRAPAETLAARAAAGTHRPWMDADAAQWFASTTAQREALYHEVANLEVDTGTHPPDVTAERVLALLEGTACAAWLGTRLATRGPA